MPPNEIKLTPVEQLGKFMLYDHTLSNPSGYACATCHVPEAGFTGPSSEVNEFVIIGLGLIPYRFWRRIRARTAGISDGTTAVPAVITAR
jgi:cytochrome c peroxidase